jgi:amidase
MDRREFLRSASASIAAGTARSAPLDRAATVGAPKTAPAEVPSATLRQSVEAMGAGRTSAVELTTRYLERIESLNRRGPELRAIIETNPRALEMAHELDAHRGHRGPLHGIPVLIKDNIETSDRMMTTAGSYALEGCYAPVDAPLVARLRAAGALILGKTNLSEWANYRSPHAASGWSGRGGQSRNPFALDRSPSGSSSGSAIAVAADLGLVAVGTETDGSIVSPASVCGLVGLKPTVGLISRRGIVPLAHSQDTAGPIARTVADAALLLSIMSGPDPMDPASAEVGSRFEKDYTRFLDPVGLKGARLGIARRFFADNAPLDRFLDGCIERLRSAGATIIDPADLPMHGAWADAENEVLAYEFKSDLNRYLARLPAHLPVHSLEELIRFNDAHAAQELGLCDQELLRKAQAKGSLEEQPYRDARARCLETTRTHGIDALIAAHRLDAIVTLTQGPAWLIDPVNGDLDTGGCSSPAAIAGYPHITVPAGLYRELPIGLSFFGAAFSEGTLIKLASAYEHNAPSRPLSRWMQI